jgi:hypothetical protein
MVNGLWTWTATNSWLPIGSLGTQINVFFFGEISQKTDFVRPKADILSQIPQFSVDEFAKEDEKYGWFRLIFLIKVNYIVKLDEYGSNLQKQEILVVLDRHMSDMAWPKKFTLTQIGSLVLTGSSNSIQIDVLWDLNTGRCRTWLRVRIEPGDLSIRLDLPPLPIVPLLLALSLQHHLQDVQALSPGFLCWSTFPKSMEYRLPLLHTRQACGSVTLTRPLHSLTATARCHVS